MAAFRDLFTITPSGKRLSPKGRAMSVDERYELVPHGDVTRVHHTVDFRNAGLPLWASALMWFIARFGRPTRKS